MLINRGNSTVMSFAADNELADIFVPSVASMNEKEAKNAAARLSQRSMSLRGSQSTSPYIVIPAEVTIVPMKLHSVNATGITSN